MRSLRPVFALFARSLRDDARSRLPTILRTVFIGIILVILWDNQRSWERSTAAGREFFFVVMMLNLGFIAVAALSTFPSAIAEEKEDETLPLLRMTNLSPVAILFGKSTSRLVAALLLLIVQVPFTLLAITLGGVSLSQVWGAYGILAATTFFLCNLALLASVYSRTIIRAGFLTALLGGTLYVVLPFVAFVATVKRRGAAGFGLASGSNWDAFWNLVVEANPGWALTVLLEPRMGGQLNLQTIWVSLGGGLLLFVVSWLLFDRYCSRIADLAPTTRKNRRGKVRRWARVPRPWRHVPLAWKDFHFMIGGRFGLYLRLVLAGALFGGVCWLVLGSSEFQHAVRHREVIASITLFLAGCCAATEILLITGRMFGTERKRQTLSSLVTLPWTVGKIIRQKVLGCLPVLLPWLLLAITALVGAWDLILNELASEFRDQEWNWLALRDPISAICYVFLQAVLFLLTIAWLSLKLRRGALPVAIALITIWNIIFGLCVDETHSRNVYIIFFVGAYLTIPAVVFVAFSFYNRIQTAAAED